MPPYLDADFADEIASSVKEMLNAKGAQRHLNTSETCFQQLVCAGLIKPDSKAGKAAKRYVVNDLDALCRRMSKGAILVNKAPSHCKTISRASLNANCPMVDTPEQFVMPDESGMPDDMEVAWANFWGVVESLQ